MLIIQTIHFSETETILNIMRKARKLFSKLIVIIVTRKFVYATGSGKARDLYRLSKFDI